METQRLSKRVTVIACEQLLEKISKSSEVIQLLIPTQAEYMAAGGEASCVQLISTWAQQQPSPVLGTWLENSDDNTQIERLTRRLYGLVAALCCETAVDKSASNVTEVLRRAALDRLDTIHGPNPRDASRGAQMELVCVDHLNRSSPIVLYKSTADGGRELRGRADFKSIAKKLLDVTVGERLGRGWSNQESEAVGGMLYETFRNTEDHALFDLNGNELKRSVRGIQAIHRVIKPEMITTLAGDFDPLLKFLSKQSPEDGQHHINLMELSIFDCGPGFAQTWLGKPISKMSIEEELAAVCDCFAIGSRKLHLGYGQGLPHVISLLRSMGGFIRLRTGRLSLYFDFANSTMTEEKLLLNSWHLNDSVELAEVAGSLLTLFLPLRRQK